MNFIKEAGLENSGLTDGESGKAIFVSTSARKFFREAYPGYKRIRNNVMNQYIAKMFASGHTTEHFRPKGKGGVGKSGEVGQIREIGGGKFVGIVSANHVRIIAIKGSPGGLPGLPQTAVPAPVEMSDRQNPGYRGPVPGTDQGGRRVPGQAPLSFPAAPQAGGVEEALEGAI